MFLLIPTEKFSECCIREVSRLHSLYMMVSCVNYISCLFMGFKYSQLNRLIEAKYRHLFLKNPTTGFYGVFSVRLLLFKDISRAMTSRTPCTSLQQTARGKSLTLPTLFLNSFVIYFDWYIFLICLGFLFLVMFFTTFQNNNVKRVPSSYGCPPFEWSDFQLTKTVHLRFYTLYPG